VVGNLAFAAVRRPPVPGPDSRLLPWLSTTPDGTHTVRIEVADAGRHHVLRRGEAGSGDVRRPSPTWGVTTRASRRLSRPVKPSAPPRPFSFFRRRPGTGVGPAIPARTAPLERERTREHVRRVRWSASVLASTSGNAGVGPGVPHGSHPTGTQKRRIRLPVPSTCLPPRRGRQAADRPLAKRDGGVASTRVSDLQPCRRPGCTRPVSASGAPIADRPASSCPVLVLRLATHDSRLAGPGRIGLGRMSPVDSPSRAFVYSPHLSPSSRR
jgi:hypothetical protein